MFGLDSTGLYERDAQLVVRRPINRTEVVREDTAQTQHKTLPRERGLMSLKFLDKKPFPPDTTFFPFHYLINRHTYI